MCLNPTVLRIIYLLKIFLNIIRFVIPIGLIIKTGLDLYKNVIDPSASKDNMKKIKNRVIAGVIVFLIPTVINLIMSLVEKTTGNNSYNGISECWEFSTMEYIEFIEKEQKEAQYQAYLTERDLLLDEASQLKLAYRRMVDSRKKVDSIGKYANNQNTIKCGTGTKYNTGLFNVVRSAGYKTREGVVAAALYLSSHINVHIPYFWSGGHFHTYFETQKPSFIEKEFYDGGNKFMGVSNKWGCSVKMDYGGTEKQKDGEIWPFGMDCSGFVAWAILNGGYYTGDGNQKIVVSTSELPSSIAGEKVFTTELRNAKGKVQTGDIVWKEGHIGMVVEVKSNSLMVAEEQGADYGLRINEYSYSSSKFTHVILMDNFYKNYQKNSSMWEGFK